jgi:anti-sigma B factor antagonist
MPFAEKGSGLSHRHKPFPGSKIALDKLNSIEGSSSPQEGYMETAIGVFSSRERVESAIGELLKSGVPKEELVFLTRSEPDAKLVGKELGAVGGFMGAATGVSAGLIAASIALVPGIGIVLALGVGATTMLGLIGAEVASEAAKTAAKSTEHTEYSGDAALFRGVLKEGHSLIIVRTESHETMRKACEILDRLGLGTQGRSTAKTHTSSRQVGDIAIIDVVGKITMGEGNVMLREIVREMSDNGINKILLNLQGVGFVDSSGIGELVRTFTTVRNKGGQLKLYNLSNPVQHLLEVTKLYAVFDIQTDEASAIKSLSGPSASRVSA